MPAMRFRALSISCLHLALAALASAQLTQTLPAGFDALPASTWTDQPQNESTDQKWQWHYDSAQFTAAGPILITDLAIRAVNSLQTVAAFHFSNWTVTLIEASTDYTVAGHHPTFATNILKSAVCRTGPWIGGPIPPIPGAPTAPWVPMGLTSGFAYDPTLGNDLIVQIEKCGTIAGWGVGINGQAGAPGQAGGNRYGDAASCASLVSNLNSNEFVPVVRITYQPNQHDLAVNAITAPVSSPFVCDNLGTNEMVSAVLENRGISPIPAGLSISIFLDTPGAGAPILEFLTLMSPLNTYDTVTFNFAATLELSATGTHVIAVSALYAADMNPSNDSQTASIQSGSVGPISIFPWIEEFDSFGATPGSTLPPPDWTNDPADAGMNAIFGDWLFLNGPTPIPGTGPSADHTTDIAGNGFYAYVHDAAANFASVSLLSPCIDLVGIANPTLGFWLHSQNAFPANPLIFQNHLSVDIISSPGGVVTVDTLGPVGHSGSSWTLQFVDLSPWIGQRIRIRFRVQSNNITLAHDMAIDDISVFDASPGPGQAPQPGFATLDVGNANDPNGLPVSLGGNGVYAAGVAVGQPVSFEFEGAPNQVILLLEGPTSASLAIYPGIGQIDLGSGLDPITGLPTGVNVVANGSLPTLFSLLFRTQPNGQQVIVFPMPNIPPGYFTTFQAAILTGGPTVIALSNAVKLFAL